MNEFLTIYLNSKQTSGNYAPCLVNLATIMSVEPTPAGYANIYFADGSVRLTQAFYVTVIKQIQDRYVENI